ncbi:uncharacterized protein L969DRAFT_44743 [Mixia osmundae IAM 14324]|uniref:Uncharacterized protein n=1 Tax=Mixia osmundae (strain CBS 9802 / IAM 14324 / JCM 22182 / KY 12970) TaxID=764103 RepID=G7DXF7_MIXOS|nr:uncharacterized protein L969DRAFT_44743 [Mixia osmundae IAM 14324]KEI41239.1 hypothetical protein L969DRAFT_44743 [Mixia osmundae IAM 14324]GAA95267.1 hypothetical protein E5Q_01923 [Mixia osmundae IAM 14324]
MDKLKKGLDKLKVGVSSATAGRVELKLRNETGLPLEIVAWPVYVSAKALNVDGDALPPAESTDDDDTKDDGVCKLLPYQGYAFDGTVPKTGTRYDEQDISLGSIRQNHAGVKAVVASHPHFGWVYFDLIKGDSSRLHLQAYLKLDRNGIVEASVGYLDVDSQDEKPQPSGELARGTFTDKDATEVQLVLTREIADKVNQVNDETHEASKIELGKGLEVSTYVSHLAGRVTILAGKEARYHEYNKPAPPARSGDIRYSKHELEGTTSKYVGLFVEQDQTPFFEGHARVNPVSGKAHGKPFVSTRVSTARFSPDGKLAMNYGFSDALQGRPDQLYCYVTISHENWLGDLIAEDAAWLEKPFSKLVLAGAHDAGMFTELDPGLSALIQSGKLNEALGHRKVQETLTPVAHALIHVLKAIKLDPARIINNIALTQKDTFANQLKLGVRFFDFRPGYAFTDVVEMKQGDLRHIHALVPGCSYAVFLNDVIEFLATHPKEIVFYEIKNDGIILQKPIERNGEVVALSMVPTAEVLAEYLRKAFEACNKPEASTIKVGGPEDLDTPIGELLKANKRLIIADRVHDPEGWQRSDSYDHPAYNTIDPATIIVKLNELLAQADKDPSTNGRKKGAIYQCQATPTSSLSEDAFASLSWSDASSLLNYMKPQNDRQIYPWIQQHELTDEGTVILLNDYVDGALVEMAIDKSRQRANLYN